MALIGSLTGSVRAQTIDFGSSAAILTASNSGQNLILSSTNTFVSSTMYLSGTVTIDHSPNTGATLTVQNRGGGATINLVSAQNSSYNSDLYMGNDKTPNPDLWTFSYRQNDNSFLYFSYTGGVFTNSMRLFTNGGVGIGPVAAGGTAPSTNVIYTNNKFGVGTGMTGPTARIHIVGGNDSDGAPIRLNSGSLLTTPLSGSIEFDGTSLYVTSGSTRQTVLTTNNAAARGADTFFFLSGSTGSRGTSTRGTALFGGDVVSSGTIRATKFEAGGTSTYVSSSNGSTLELGASTQVLILSGGGSSSTDPRNFQDTNFFVSGSNGSRGGSTKGTATFGGDLFVTGLIYGGGTTNASAIFSFFHNGQYAYWQNQYSINPGMYLTAQGGNTLLSIGFAASTATLTGKMRFGSLTAGPTAYLHPTASSGAATTAPLKFDSGSLMATPEAGAVEYDATRLYLTDGSSTRKNILMSGDVTGTFNDVSAAFVTTASVSFSGARTNGMTYFASRSAGTISTGADVFFYVSGTARQGHGSTAASAAKRVLFDGDVVTSGTLQLLSTNASIPTIGSDVLFFVSGSGGSKNTSFSRGVSVFGGDAHVSGTMYVGQVSENVALTSSAGGSLTFDMSGSSIFYVNGPTSDITANFTNVLTETPRIISANIILSQSATARIVTAVQIAGAAQTINWSNGVTPTGNASKQDIFGFSLLRSGSAWKVFGQMSTYG